MIVSVHLRLGIGETLLRVLPEETLVKSQGVDARAVALEALPWCWLTWDCFASPVLETCGCTGGVRQAVCGPLLMAV